MGRQSPTRVRLVIKRREEEGAGMAAERRQAVWGPLAGGRVQGSLELAVGGEVPSSPAVL